MEDREYIEKEAKMIYRYIIQDNEKFDSKKQLYARILNSIKNTAQCDIGGIENLDLSLNEIKSIIKEIVES
ncbi:hypothetical protein H9660_04260 [Clostridium sp. Sa3CUN1]|uniref:Uncharacterized protein n=1 Tax=Clostridium gallinarum TaxID=2762246 RepID=A0ABR8Q1Q4_9CLOT|nr:hypothetical protein [Clostridium gallinarum]MBD7914350.1 hypothetical protein [Clostridium gallinarum]